MKQFDPNHFDNLYDSITLTHTQIEEIIRGYNLMFPQVRNKEVEWGIQFPMFIPTFYRHVLRTQSIPNQNEFWALYKTEHMQTLANHNDDILWALQARVFRTYPSIVRDIHFGLLLKNKLVNHRVLYNLKLDIEEGIDLMAIHGDRYWAINLFINSARAQFGRSVKENRHVKFDNVHYVEVPASYNTYQVGQFFLYGQAEYNMVLKEITIQ